MNQMAVLAHVAKTAKGQVAAVVMELVMGLVMLFVGLFMIAEVSSATAINNTSDFYATYTSTITTVSTVFSVAGLVLIIIALATAVRTLRGVTA